MAAFINDRDVRLQATSPRYVTAASTNGLNNATVLIYQRAATNVAPALPSAATTYTYSPAGLAGLTNGWSFTMPAPAAGAFLFVSTQVASATTATVSLPASGWAPAQLQAQDGTPGTPGSNGTNGARGPGNFYASGTTWTDAAANAAVPAPKQTGDVVTISGTGFAQTKKWDGTAWNLLGAVYDPTLLLASSLDATKFASSIEPVTLVSNPLPAAKSTNNVFNTTDQKLYRWNGTAYVTGVTTADVSGVLPLGQIPTIPTTQVSGVLPLAQIPTIPTTQVSGVLPLVQIPTIPTTQVSGIVPLAQIPTIPTTQVSGVVPLAQIPTIPTTQVSGVLPLAQIPTIPTTQVSGIVPIAQIPSIPTTQLSGTITAAQITANSITSAQIKANTITSNEIATNYVYAGAIQANQIAANSITASQISASYVYAGTIQASQITANSITSTQISSAYVYAGTIQASQIAANSITASQISSSYIYGGTIQASQIAANSITATQINSSYVYAGTIQASQIAANSITASQIATNYVYAGTIQANQIAANSITSGQIAAGAINADRINGNNLTINDAAGNVVFAVSTVTGNDSAASLGFNPNFSNWSATYPAGWSAWSGAVPVKEIGTVLNSPYSVRYLTSAAADQGITQVQAFGAALPAGTYVEGCFSMYMVGNAGGGSPGYLVRLFTNSIQTTYVDTVVPIPDKTVSGWQRMPFVATANNQAIFAIRIYQMASWAGMPGGNMAAGSAMLFGPFTFEVRNQMTAANIGTFMANAAIQNAQIGTLDAGKITTGSLDANRIAANSLDASKIAANTITAGQIAANYVYAGTIQANQIAANSITAGQIAAGAITATELKAGAITADRLAVGDFTNLCDNAGFELGNIGWTMTPGCVIRVDASAKNGSYLGAVPSGTGVATIRNNNLVSVVPGDVFYARGWMWSGSVNDTGYIRITTYDKNGTEIGSSGSAGGVASGWTLKECSITVPAGIAKIRMEFVANVSVGGQMLLDSAGLFRVSGSVLIQDGAVTASKITVANLAAISAELGSAVISADGSLRSGQASYDTGTGWWWGFVGGVPKMSIGVGGAANSLKWDGTSLSMGGGVLVNGTAASTVTAGAAAGQTAKTAQDNKPVASIDSSGVSTSRANSTTAINIGTAIGSATGGNGALIYSWSLITQETNPTGLSATVILTTPSASSTTITVRLPADTSVIYTATLTVTDAAGYSSTASFTKNIQFGVAR